MSLWFASHAGVTTTEYALILAVVAVLAYGSYLMIGSGVSSLANGIDSMHAERGADAGGPCL
jgi:Flp pilus assembly pilin Flp